MTSKEITTEQIEVWRKKYGEIFHVEVGGKSAYLKRPDRRAISAAAVVGKSDPLKHNEVLLNNCWLGGDEEIKVEDALFYGVSNVLPELIETKVATLKKL